MSLGFHVYYHAVPVHFSFPESQLCGWPPRDVSVIVQEELNTA